MELIAHRRVDLEPLVTHRFALDQIEDAFDLFSHQRQGVLKIALHPTMPASTPVGAAFADHRAPA
jgi:threonine dehydrogenase-like Zn-dependent dehydrogenase